MGKTNARLLVIALLLMAVYAVLVKASDQPAYYNYTPILETIAKGESRGNYNAYYGNAGNTKINFTAMSVDDVLAWQEDYVKKGSPSSAVGKYQFVRPTLAGLVEELKIDRSQLFTASLQDRLAVALLERRGVHDYMKGKLTREQFAHNLSKEWAALPAAMGSQPNASYYEGDGLNKVQIPLTDVYASMDQLSNY